MGLCSSKKNPPVNRDPLDFLDRKLYELIFQHLSAENLLMASEVSPKWYRATANSKTMLEKIVVKIVNDEQAFRDQIFTIVLLSPREYQNMMVFSQNKKEIVTAFSGSLVELFVKDYDLKSRDLFFPNLKKLVLDGDAIVDGLLSCASNLEELHVKHIRFPVIDTLKDCLVKNSNLTSLKLGASPCLIFNEDLSSSFEFKLSKLSVKIFYLHDTTNFFNFIVSQASTLTELTIHVTYCENSILNVTINHLQNLEKLCIYSPSDLYGSACHLPQELPDGLDLNVNKSIKVLCVDMIQITEMGPLKILLAALPNLETFRMHDATMPTFGYTMRNASKITEFRTSQINLHITKAD